MLAVSIDASNVEDDSRELHMLWRPVKMIDKHTP